MIDSEFNLKKIYVTLFLVSIYFLSYSIYELFYIYDIYSCDRLNLCINSELRLSYSQIYFLQLIKILASALILWPKTRTLSLMILLSTQCLFMFANKFLHSPEQAYLNFLILILIVMNLTQILNTDSKIAEKMKTHLIWVYSVVFFLSYSYSGFTKYSTNSWMQGDFMLGFFKTNHLVYSSIYFQYVPKDIFSILTFGVVFMEMFSFLSIFSRPLKVFFWFGLTFIQVGLILTTDLWQVSFGMLVCHIFVMDGYFINLKIWPGNRIKKFNLKN